MKNLLIILATISLFSNVSMAAMSFKCTDNVGRSIYLTVVDPTSVVTETDFARGNLKLAGVLPNQPYAKFSGVMLGKESKVAFNTTILVSIPLLTAKAIPGSFSLGNIVIEGPNGQAQSFSCR